jgi:translocation and assembly module TamB
MTQPNNLPPEIEPEQESRGGLPLILKIGAGAGLVVIAGGVAALIWGKDLINQQVIPRVENALEETLDRPFELGNVESLSLRKIRVGPSTLPPTDEVQTEATVEAVDITLSWPDLIFDRTLRPSITFIEPDVKLVQAADGRWIDLTLPDPEEDKTEGPISFELQQVRVVDAQISVDRDVPRPEALIEAQPILLEGVDAEAEFLSPNEQDLQEVLFEVAGQLDGGEFEAQGEGILESQEFNVALQTSDLPTTGVNLFLPPELGVASGTLNSNLTAEIRLENEDQPATAQGVARLRDGEVQVSQLNEPIRDINTTLRFQGDEVLLEDTGLQVGDIPLTAAGTVNLDNGYDLTAAIPRVSIDNVTRLLETELLVDATGEFQFEGTVTGALDQPELTGQIENLGPIQVDQVAVETLSANFAANQAQVDLRTLRIIPAAGGFLTASGQVDLEDLANPGLNFDFQTDLPADALAADYGVSLPEDVVIGSVQAQGQIRGTVGNPQATAQFQLAESTYPGRGELAFRDNTLVLDNTQFQVDTGTINASAIARLDDGNWSADLTTANVPVDRFTDQAQGLLTADLTASGNLNNFDLATIDARGNAEIADAAVFLTPGSPSLLEPGDWTTSFRWAGNGVEVERFNAPGVAAAGFIATNLAASPPIDSIDLNVQLDRYDLNRLAQLAPSQVAEQLTVAGLASFDGEVTGPLQDLQIAGNARLDNLALNQFAFEPVLSGPLQASLAEGGSIDLRGTQDRITASVNADLTSGQFDVQLGNILAEGELVDRQLTADVQNFPIESLGLAPARAYGLGPLAGTVDATVTGDLSDLGAPTAQGTIDVANLALGDIVADSFMAEFSYANDVAELIQGDLQFANSQYLLSGQVNLAPAEPLYDARLDIVSGNFQDIFSALGWETFADIGFRQEEPTAAGAEALDVTADALPMASFLEQLEAFARFMANYEQQDDQTRIALPPLDALQGGFSGTITAEGEGFSPDDLQATVNLQGQDWLWGNLLTCDGLVPELTGVDNQIDTVALDDVESSGIPCNQFQLVADYAGGAFTVDPLSFEADEFLVSFDGSGNFDALDGQLRVEGVPVELAELFVEVPVDVTGALNTTAQLSGSLANPRVEGTLAVAEPTLNQRPLESVELDFGYTNAVLSFDGGVVVEEPAEIALQGTVPYALPFMTVQPPTNMIDILASLQNESMQILNLVTDDQFRWEGGDGQITVQVGGTLADPAVVGEAQFQDGELSSTALSQPVTGLTGEVLFNLDRVQVNDLQADYGGGTLLISGRLPLDSQGQDTVATLAGVKQVENPSQQISVAIDQVNIDFEQFLQAQIDGEIAVTGAVLEPVISGDISVGQGRVQANRMLAQFGSDMAPEAEIPTPEDESSTEPLPEYIVAYQERIDGFDVPEPAAPVTDLPLDRIALNGLNINLTDELTIAGQPFYYIQASGDLSVSGTPLDLRPRGTITLNRGWINLFSTQFRLVSSANNTATFSPQTGLDPFLDVEMRARVQQTDATQVVATSPFVSAEVTDNTGVEAFGQVNFITVFASAYGYVSELQEADSPGQTGGLISLTSRPSRSQDELLTLLGESVVTNIYGASLNQLAGFLGSGTLAGFGDRLADTVGLRSFSVFPTTDPRSESTAGIGIGVEAAFQIGEKITIDGFQILNSGNPPQVGLSYQFLDQQNQQLRSRVSTNLSGDNIVSVEYEIRF